MKKVLFIMMGLAMSISSFAQEQASQEKESKLNVEYTLDSRRIHRGVGLGTSPSLGATVSYAISKSFTISTNGIGTTNLGFSSLENTLSYKYKNFTVSASDMYFINDFTTTNYFDYNDSTTHHLINGTIKYSDKKFYGLVQTTVYKSDKNNGVYFEAGYKLLDNLSVNAGYVTDASTMSFRTKEGVTHVGLSSTNKLKLSSTFTPSVTTSLYVNPSYKYVTPGVNNNPVQFAVGLVF